MDVGEDREYSRQPRLEDLTKICAALNREGARYILIGGFAVIAGGEVLLVIQRFAERDEVFELRCASVAAIVLIIHSSASS